MRYFALFALLGFSLVTHAAIYMQTDANGNITYSDTPLNNSSMVEIPELNSSGSNVQTVPSTVKKVETTTTVTSVAEEPTAKPYSEFAIFSPKDEETIQNQPDIPVEVLLRPKLQRGDRIQLLVDGKLVGDASPSTHLQTGLIERGPHQISAIILNENQQVIQQTNPIKIYVHRANLNSSPSFKQNTSSNTKTNRNLLQSLSNLFNAS